MSTTPTPTIASGAYVVVQKLGGEHIRVCRLHAGQKINIEKLQFDPAAAIGERYGMFEVNGGQIKPISLPTLCGETVDKAPLPSKSHSSLLSSMIGGTVTGGAKLAAVGGVSLPGDSYDTTTVVEVPAEAAATTSCVLDDETSTTTTTVIAVAKPSKQRMTAEEIEVLKGAGTRTVELVSRLIDGSATFASRSTHAKQKYVQKKAKKHSDLVLLSRPTIRLLCECYYRPSPDRVANLRPDLLGLVLQLSAIHHGCRVLVFEQTTGLLLSALIERLGGRGACVHLHQGKVPQAIPCLNAMEFSKEQLSVYCPLSISALLSCECRAGKKNEVKHTLNDEGANGISAEEPPKKRNPLKPAQAPDAQKQATGKESGQSHVSSTQTKSGQVGQDCCCGSLDSIVLALKNVSAIDIISRVYESLRPSGIVVIYASVQELLLPAYEWLRKHGAIQIHLQDQFYRVHQVIEGRTHPAMHQAVAGGYILSAIKIEPHPPPPQSETRKVEKR